MALSLPTLAVFVLSRGFGQYIRQHFFDKTFQNLYHANAFDLALLIPYFVVLVLLASYGIHRYVLVYLYYKNKKNHTVKPRCEFSELPRVTVQLPIFNERFVVERLLDAVCGLNYPLEKLDIQLLDDSTDETRAVARGVVDRYAVRGFPVTYHHRTNREGYKAGALAEGMKTATGEFIAIFDADFVPPEDFLLRTIHHFTDPKIGMVQTRWTHINRNYSFLTEVEAILLDGHFVLEHSGRARSDVFFNFNGTAGIWRRRAIEEAGGWQHDTLTEDTDLSYRDQLFHVKLEAWYHLTANLSYPLMVVLSVLLLPAMVIRFYQGWFQMLYIDLPLFLASTFSISSFYLVSQRELFPKTWPRALLYLPFLMALGIGLSITNTRAVLEALLGKQTEFARTPKYRVEAKIDRMRTKKYRRRLGWVPWLELLIGGYFALTVYYALVNENYITVPFLILFVLGYWYTGLMSLLQGRFAGLSFSAETHTKPFPVGV